MDPQKTNKPWLNEPDRLEFEAHGFPCLIRRAPLGNLCGYVAVPVGHPYHRKDYANMDISVHGGLTYAGECRDEICHVPKIGESDDVWWFGFDCAHFLDVTPKMVEMREPGGILHDLWKDSKYYTQDTYKDINYVKQECIDLARQLRKAA
jgi:hypothetical protein